MILYKDLHTDLNFNKDISTLLENKEILLSKGRNIYKNYIFPKSTPLNEFTGYDSTSIITRIEDSLFTIGSASNSFASFKIANKYDYVEKIYNIINVVDVPNNISYQRKELVSNIQFTCKPLNDIDNTILRYRSVDLPLDVTHDKIYKNFINDNLVDLDTNLPISNLNVDNKLVYENNNPTFIESKLISNIASNTNNSIDKLNDITFFNQILKFAKSINVEYIYCIIEYRPYIYSEEFCTPYTFYKIIGK